MRRGTILIAGLMGVTLAACGTTPTDRAISGAGIGAGLGAAGAAVADGDMGEGALIGGAAGALAGALVDERQVYLGEPIWRR